MRDDASLREAAKGPQLKVMRIFRTRLAMTGRQRSESRKFYQYRFPFNLRNNETIHGVLVGVVG